MPWVLEHNEELKTITELLESGTSDRVVGVLAGAYVDERLLSKIKKRLIAVEEDSDLHSRIFEFGGPLSSFGARINMGFMLGIYGEEVRQELNAIARIRNEFAHRTSVDFSIPRVARHIHKLKLLERFRHPIERDMFAGGSSDLDEAWFTPQGRFPVTGRGVYLFTAQILIGYIWTANDARPTPPKPLPLRGASAMNALRQGVDTRGHQRG